MLVKIYGTGSEDLGVSRNGIIAHWERFLRKGWLSGSSNPFSMPTWMRCILFLDRDIWLVGKRH
jgi:hypothetical protein